jgi:hypothetical protein
MKITDAVKRLKFTVSNKHKPNESDIEALNVVLEQLKLTQEKTIQDNLLFAKLYAYVLGKMAGHYSDVDGAQKHLNKLLSQPFNGIVHILEMELRAMETRQVFADPMLESQSPSKLKETITKYPKFYADFVACWEYWDYDNVVAHLKSNINLSLQKYKNHE